MQNFDLKVEIKEIPVEKIFENTGQIPNVPENPRRISDEDFELLKKSIQDSPEMKNLDEVKVYPYEGNYIAIGGNHRLRAYKELGWKNVLCKILPEDTPVEKLQEYIMKENMQYASNDPYKLQSWNQDKLEDWGVLCKDEWADLPNFDEEENLGKPSYGKTLDIKIRIPIEKRPQREEIKIKVIDLLSDYEVEVI